MTGLPPGAEASRRFRPQLRYELLGCALTGHELVATDLRETPSGYGLVVIEPRVEDPDDHRWHRCLRCDSWLPLEPPRTSSGRAAPALDDIAVPLRGRPLRDRFVLRAIAVDRVVHFLALAALAVVVLLFAQHKSALQGDYTQVLNRLQGAVGGPFSDTKHSGILSDLDKLFALSTRKLYLYGAGLAGYALLNGVEAVGLWRARRWAEYLAFLEVVLLLPIEVHELTVRVSPLKILTIVLNLAVAGYLLYAHRLFRVRGGGAAFRAERERDAGWPAVRRATPWLGQDTATVRDG